MADRQITYGINFNTDTASLQKIQDELLQIQNMTKAQYFAIKGADAAEEDLIKIRTAAAQVKIALENSFNVKLNTFDIGRFNDQLAVCKQSLKSVEQTFTSLGSTGQAAFIDLTNAIFTANTQVAKTKSFLDKIGETIFNAAKWSVAYGAINNISNGIKSAWNYAISLDSALNDIRIVTGNSYEQMEKFAVSANRAAQALGTTTKNYTKGALIYYQQGLSEKDVLARTEVTAKAANVTGQTVQEVSEQLTAVWNGYKVAADEAEAYVDRLAAVAASSASDLEELSTAMSRVASSASTMGINVDQLTAQIATIESVTRQDAASIGTALKTIYSRMGDLAVGAEDEFGVALGDVSGKMKQMGIDILDQEGNMRSMGTVIEEVAAKWNTWTSAQRQAAAVALAGKRQYNNLFALFENWDMYEANKAVSETSLGELQKEQDIYMESTAAHLKELSSAFEKIKESLFDNKQINKFLEALTGVADMIDGIVRSFGGGLNLVTQFSAVLMRLYSGKIAQGFTTFIKSAKESLNLSGGSKEQTKAELANKYKLLYDEKRQNGELDENDATYQTINWLVELEQQRAKYASILTTEDNKRYDDLMDQVAALGKQKLLYQDIAEIVNQSTSQEDIQPLEKRQAEIEGKPDSKKMSLLDKVNRDTGAISTYADEKEVGQKKFAKDAAKRLLGAANEEINSAPEESAKALKGALENVQKTMNEEGEVDLSIEENRKTLLTLSEALTKAYNEEANALKNKIAAAQNEQGLTPEQIAQMSVDDKNKLKQSAQGRKDDVSVLKRENTSNKNKISNFNDEKALKSSKNLIKAAQDELKLGKLNIAQKGELKEAISAVNSVTKDGTSVNLEDEKVKNRLLKLADVLGSSYINEQKNCDALVDSLDSMGQSMDANTQKTEKLKNEQNGLFSDNKATKMIQNITNIASTLMSLGSTITSVINTFKEMNEVASDESLSSWEKVKTIAGLIIGLFTAVFSTVSMLAPLIKNIIISNIKETGEQGAQAAATANAKITAALGWIGLILAAVSAITALIIAVASAVNSQETALEKAQKDYEAARKTLEAMTSALQTAKENYASLGETIDKYKSARDNIDNLKAGTDEFKEAVYEANLQALELINTYDILSQYANYNKNGILEISDAGFDELLKQERNKISQQQLGILYQQNTVAQKRKDVILEKEYNKRYQLTTNKKKATTLYGNVSEILSEKTDEEIQQVIKYFSKNLLLRQGDKSKPADERNREFLTALKEGAQAIQKTNATIEKTEKAIVQNTLAINSQNYADVKNKDAYTNMVAANTKTTRAIKSFYTGSDNIVVANRGGGVGGNYWLNSDDIATQLYKNNKITEEEKKKLSDALAEKGMSTVPELLASFYGVDKNDLSVQRNSKGGASVYYTKEGTTHKIDFSQVENIIQSQVATIFTDTVLGPEFRDFINSYTTGERGGQNSRGTQGKYADILNLTGGKTNAHLNNTTLADLNKMSWNNLPQEIKDKWEEFGFSSQKGLQKAYEAAIGNSKKAINEGFAEIHSLGADITGEFTEEEMKSLVNGYNQVFSQLGKDGVNQLNTLLNQFAPEEAAKIANAISNVDLTSVTNISDFVTALEKTGVEIDLTDSKWQNWLDTLATSQNILREVINNFKNIRTVLANIKKITEGLSIGDIISDEDYQQIIAYNAAARDWFVQTADGYKLVKGSAESLASFLKTPYKNLEDIEANYNKLEDIGTKRSGQRYNAAATGEDLQNEYLKFFGSSKDDLLNSLKNDNSLLGRKAYNEIKAGGAVSAGTQNYINYYLKNLAANSSDLDTILATTDISKDEFLRILATPYDQLSEKEREKLQQVLGTTNDIITTTANGGYSREAALERWGIDISGSYDEVVTAYNEGKFGAKDSAEANKIFKKIRSSYVADWANKYGLSVDTINKLSNDGKNDFKMLQNLEFLQNYEKIISKLQDTAQYLTGEALAENLKAQNEQFEKAKTIKDAIIAAQKEELGVTGQSYDEILKAYQENAGKLTAEQQEKYEALLSAMKESADLSNNISDNLISAADAIIEASQKSTDNLKFWSEFNRKYMENGKFKGGWAAQSELSTKDRFEISEDNLQADLKLIKDYDEEISKLENKLNNQSLSEADRAKYNQQLEEFKKGRAETIEGYYDDIEELYSAWSNGWDLINSKLEDHISRLEKVNELYDGIMTLNKIVDKNYFGQDLLDKQVANSLAIAQASYRQVQELQNQLNTEGLTEERKAEIETELAEAAANAMTAYSNYFEKLKSAAQAELNNIFDQRGITEASERWERQKTYDDQYLNVADAQLNINKIQKNYKSAIENASSLAAQTQLRVKMEEELNKLQANRNKLTQYEVDRANAVYELTLKQIALEESQRNASKMKLTRDANGNLTYAFAQDQDAAAAAQAELEEAQNNLFNIDNDELRSRVDKYYQYQSEAQAALAQALADGDKERYNELREYYYGDNGLLTQLRDSLSSVQENLKGSFKAIFPEGDIESLSAFAEATKVSTINLQDMADKIGDVGNKFGDSVDKLKSLLDGEEGLVAKLDILVGQLQPNEEDEKNLNNQIDDIRDYLDKIAKKLGAVEDDINNTTSTETDKNIEGIFIPDNKQPTIENDSTKIKDILSPGLGTVTDISVGPIDSDKILPYPGSWNNNNNYPSSDKIFSNINSNNSAKTTNNSITINNSFPNATDTNGVISAIEGMGGQINMFIDDTTK